MSMLYKKHNFLDKNIDFLFSTEIYEYDIKEAGWNIIKEFNLVDDNIFKKLNRMSKHKRKIYIGILQKNKDFAKKLNEGFIEARRLFFEANDITDNDILSIKRDAIFVLRPCTNTRFGNIYFDTKHDYTSYLYLNKYEFYYNKKTGIDVKGLKDVSLHKEYMIQFMYDFIKLMENNNNRIAIAYMNKFIELYKKRQLDIGYYRELNLLSNYKTYTKCFDLDVYVEYFVDYDNLDISYNYFNYIVPMIQILI